MSLTWSGAFLNAHWPLFGEVNDYDVICFSIVSEKESQGKLSVLLLNKDQYYKIRYISAPKTGYSD